jgi:proline iminopeptidase
VLFLHGGPGAGASPAHRRFFDPAHYRIVVFDQRGAGRSTPIASIEANTTDHLVADIERLREHLGIGRWIVFGGSWGSTLALAYAARHPERCAALVLRGIWLCRPGDLGWWLYGVRAIFPEHWSRFAGYLPEAERGDLLKAYHRRLVDPDPTVSIPAAVAWKTYESRIATLLPRDEPDKPANARTLAMSRIECHYMANACFLGPDELIRSVPRFRRVPGFIVHGRYDIICPVEGALALAQAWPEARLEIVPDAGHAATEPGTRRALIGFMAGLAGGQGRAR